MAASKQDAAAGSADDVALAGSNGTLSPDMDSDSRIEVAQHTTTDFNTNPKKSLNSDHDLDPATSDVECTPHPHHESDDGSNNNQTLPLSTTGEPPSEAPAPSADTPPVYTSFTLWEKRLIVLAASFSAFFSPLTAQIYLPALTVIADEFAVSSSQINLTVTTYMVFQGITPMFIGGFADAAGRRPAYLICFVIYIAANIGLALSRSYVSLLVVRCLQSAGSSTTVALAQAVLADTITSAERGQYIGITVIPVVLAPSLGPVIGGLLAQYLGWRWIFWFLTIIASVNLVAMLLFFPETCRRIVGDGSVRPHPIYRTCWQMLKDAHHRRRRNSSSFSLHRTTSTTPELKFKGKAPNPLISLHILFEKELFLLLFYSSVVFASFYATATSMPSIFAALYGFTNLQVGLMYLPMAGGSVVASAIVGPAMGRNFARHARRLGRPVDKARQMDLVGFPIERARLEVGVPLLVLSCAVILAWGWALQAGAPVAVPCVLLFLQGVGMIGFVNAINVLIVDIHPGNAGAATAANNLTRCLLGAVASAVVVPMIDAIGAGWAYTIFGVLYVVLAPMLVAVMWYGVRWRAEEAEKRERRKRAKAEKGEESGSGMVVDGGSGLKEEEGTK
ncbi:major facilitator superfamily domain-containing protein [Podospora appendiculata]|uniref:Major facilitator superfamily domain-containing protein n=1 Tax=Podospora appendiculata TaxID=314037 RepID=A0AAE0X9Y2_9PEZI|nr:major facilitator superfamily domain-containing protein [Podospora appendiculata]